MDHSFLSAFILLLLVLDPLGSLPVFIPIMHGVPRERRTWLALREVGIAFGVLVAFMFLGGAQTELLARVDQVVAEREPLREALRAQGWDVPPSQGNFVWMPAGEGSVRLSQVFEDAGVLVRCFAGEGVRVTVTTAADRERVVAAAAAVSASDRPAERAP